MDFKRCSKCGELKPLTDFFKDKTKKSGYKSQCKQCLNTKEKRDYYTAYRETHKDYFREKHAEYRSRNREKLKVLSKQRRLDNPGMTKDYYLKNKDRILEYSRIYHQSERGKAILTYRRMIRRSIFRDGDTDITLEKLYNLSSGICAICGEKCDYNDFVFRGDFFIAGNKYPSIDHIKPLSKGGTHTWDNIQLAHRQCNSIKNNK